MLFCTLWLLACGPPDAPHPRPDPQDGTPQLAPIAPPAGASRYTLSFPRPQTRTFEVRAEHETRGAPQLELMMATWTPGSYLIRDYAGQLEGVTAEGPDGPLPVRKTHTNRWVVDTEGAEAVAVRYTVWASSMTVRTNFVDASMAMLNGAPTFLVPADRLDEAARVHVDLPDDWSGVATALRPVEGQPNTFLAADFDELVDAPLVAGDPVRRALDVPGVPHTLVTLGLGSERWDHDRAAADVATLVKAQQAFWGTVPYDRYVFLNVLGEVGGGLEHAHSTLMLTSRWNTGDDEDYRRWLGLVSHEFFHTWNVKRLRPEALGPFDYERVQLTGDLWIAEGFTSYYDDLLLVRAGLLDRDAYLKRMSKNLERLQGTPGRTVQPLSEASWDAWIKYYKPDENSPNTGISYYTKGAVVAWLLDVEIRRATRDLRSLDDVMREASARYSGERGYSTQAFRALVSEVAGTDLGPWLARAVDGTEELDYAPALAWYGLTLAGDPSAELEEEEPSDDDDPPAGWLGVELDGSGHITRVDRDTPAFVAGVNVGDEVLAIDEDRVSGGGWRDRLTRHPPGSTAELLVSRRGRLLRLPVTFSEAPDQDWSLSIDDSASPRQRRRLEQWLGVSAD